MKKITIDLRQAPAIRVNNVNHPQPKFKIHDRIDYRRTQLLIVGIQWIAELLCYEYKCQLKGDQYVNLLEQEINH